MHIQLGTSELDIRSEANGLVSLTDLWKSMGSPDKKSPTDWQERESTIDLIDTLTAVLNTPKMGVLKASRGRYGGTWAHKNLALSYAKWLSPELHLAVNQAFLERLDEEANPELAIQRGTERAVRKWKADGKSDKWIEARLKGVATRNSFTKTLAAHGVKYGGFKVCTNAIYTPLYGGTAEVVRLKKGLPEKVNIRENVSALELKAIEFAEAMAQENIDAMNLKGNAQCELACTHASRSVAKALIDNKKLA
ncbi:KilA-N domain-containing protein [Spirosoma endbachense]|uniref:KilA-N domain-containing protein n=1 Tax=Spirosoma endbachense TaxID=2666025 RepID=A0A6P1W6B4_9BACT|nr:KilA-N domain-containing protein [Spirosoma endbachense]QHV99266.1 hypothetical protein GJR95_31510 [Spirosoma endbachense]